MENIRVVVERAEDGFISAFSEDVDGLFGAGETVEKAKASIKESIDILKDSENAPEVLKGDYTIDWIYDVESLLSYLKTYMTFAGMERFTGIRAKQLQHYSTGLKKPRRTQRERIVRGLTKLGEQLQNNTKLKV